MNNLLNIYIGYEPAESIAWHTMAHSLYSKSSKPIALIPLNDDNLKGLYTRPRDPNQSNSFSFTRFLVPFLNEFKGYAIYFDCDQMLRVDVNEIFEEVKNNPGKAVYVVKHNYTPSNNKKYLNTQQLPYPRKNWSSVVVWDCSHPSNMKVDLEFVNSSTPMTLHRFLWLDDDEIGGLDIKWNWLVGEYENPPKDVKNVHWTVGGPYFNEYRDADFSDEWFREQDKAFYCKQLP